MTTGSGWQQQTQEKHPTNVRSRGSVGTRRERRSIPQINWLTSLPQRKIIHNSQQYKQHLLTILKRREAA